MNIKSVPKNNILVVDDNPKNVQYISMILTNNGYNVAIANNGEKALRYVEKRKPDLILLDIMMPELSGFEVCETLKRNSSTQEIPIIFLTAKTDVDDIVKAFEVGGVDYITKPFNPKEIIVRIKTHIELKKSKETIEQQKKSLEELNESLEKKVLDRTNELLQAKDKAEEMNRLKSNFLTNMSHELRTPLVAILGASQILSMDLESSKNGEWASMIYKSGKRLMETLNLILDLSKIEAKKIELKYVKVSLNSLIAESVKLFEPLAASKNIFIKAEYNSGNLIIIIDERLIVEVLNNIINNAVKFTEVGGVTVSLFLTNESIIIRVTDTGIGIPEDKLNEIFEEFRQVSEGTNRTFEGTGLGLTITKRFVELMGGKIFVESKYNQGSSFSVHLPIRYLLNEGEINEAKVHPNQFGSIRVENKQRTKPHLLIVDDDENTIAIINKFLSEYFFLNFAKNGEDALVKAGDKKYNAVLVDINLGRGINGLDVVNYLKNQKGFKKLPLIALTSYAMEGDKEGFLSKGFTHYIAKPFDGIELVKFINDAIKEY